MARAAIEGARDTAAIFKGEGIRTRSTRKIARECGSEGEAIRTGTAIKTTAVVRIDGEGVGIIATAEVFDAGEGAADFVGQGAGTIAGEGEGVAVIIALQGVRARPTGEGARDTAAIFKGEGIRTRFHPQDCP